MRRASAMPRAPSLSSSSVAAAVAPLSGSSASFPRPSGQGRSSKPFSTRGFPVMGLLLVITMASFYAGISVGWHGGAVTTSVSVATANSNAKTDAKAVAVEVENSASSDNENESDNEKNSANDMEHGRTLEALETLKQQLKDAEDKLAKCQAENTELKSKADSASKASNNNNNNNCQTEAFRADAFPEDHTGSFASGMEFVDRVEFAETYDTGVPLDESKTGNDQVMILYSDPSAFPSNSKKDDSESESSRPISVTDATANCHNLHVVLTQAPRKNQCIAIMGQYESYHLQKFMRVDTNATRGAVDKSLPLTYVSRGYQQNGRKSAKVPTTDQSKDHWKSLVPYLQTLDDALESLGPVLKEVASHNDHNAVVVMVCNFGQSELLLNFICNARAKGFGDLLQNILLFATDQETHDLAQSMGITSVYIESIFGSMPTNAAKRYADKTFKQMMAAKVYCVQMVSMLGYDILFQDVDVVWYKNPLEWFHDESSPHYHFDIYFQDDGNHGLFYAPYSANTGFYYVRNNKRTQFFFNSLLMAGDLIISTSSHQIALIALLNEHASMYGLLVKIWERNKHEFPGGFTFHNRKSKGFLKELMGVGTNNNNNDEDKDDTYVFHMSWTASKTDKVKFFQQMGEWYLQDTCVGAKQKQDKDKEQAAIESSDADADADSSNEKTEECCAADPLVTCHYRDKPSKIPCKDSPPIDKGAASFW